MLEIQGVQYNYQFDEGLNGINATFEKGKIYTVLGKKGSGKTTLTSLLANIIVPESGSILIDGKNSLLYTRKEHAKLVSVLRKKYDLVEELTILQNMKLYLKQRGSVRGSDDAYISKMLRFAGISNKQMKQLPAQVAPAERFRANLVKIFLDPTPIICLDVDALLLERFQCKILLYELIKKSFPEDLCILYLTQTEYILPGSNEFWGINKGNLLFVKDIENN